jgi:hypothetical protein
MTEPKKYFEDPESEVTHDDNSPPVQLSANVSVFSF